MYFEAIQSAFKKLVNSLKQSAVFALVYLNFIVVLISGTNSKLFTLNDPLYKTSVALLTVFCETCLMVSVHSCIIITVCECTQLRSHSQLEWQVNMPRSAQIRPCIL